MRWTAASSPCTRRTSVGALQQPGTGGGTARPEQDFQDRVPHRIHHSDRTRQAEAEGLFQDAGISAKASDDLEVKSSEYLALAESLAGKARARLPLPEPPKTTQLIDLRARG